MDLLFTKYASPFLFLDGMIQTGRFCEFIIEFIQLDSEQKAWEFYLHKVFENVSFEDFKASLISKPAPTKENLETTVKESRSILSDFKPE